MFTLLSNENSMMDICVTWYVDCLFSLFVDNGNHGNSATSWTWPLYEECVDGIDALTNDLDDCQQSMSYNQTNHGPLIVQIPKQYANCALHTVLIHIII